MGHEAGESPSNVLFMASNSERERAYLVPVRPTSNVHPCAYTDTVNKVIQTLEIAAHTGFF